METSQCMTVYLSVLSGINRGRESICEGAQNSGELWIDSCVSVCLYRHRTFSDSRNC